MIYHLPKEWFFHTVIYRKEDERAHLSEWDNQDGEPIEEIEVSKVRFTGHVSRSQTLRGVNDTSRGALYVLPGWSSFTEFEKGNKIVFEGQEYVIERVDTYHQPTNQNVHHWRLELV